MQPKPKIFKSLRNGELKYVGCINVTEFYRDKTFNEDIFITTPDTNSNNLLSRNASVNLGIIKFIGDVAITDSLFGFGHWRPKPVKLALKMILLLQFVVHGKFHFIYGSLLERL